MKERPLRTCAVVSRKQLIYSVCNTLLGAKKGIVQWLPAEVMQKIKPLKLIIALSGGLSFLTIIILSSWSSTFNLRRLDGNYTATSRVADFHEAESNATVTTTAEKTTLITSKPFIYLTQTEQCLPQHLASSTRIGDSKTCNCDVIVLSYKVECKDEKPSHISYVFANNSTWTTGRNLLYFVAIERIRHYHYYIFLDDDVDLRFSPFSSQDMKRLTPFRAFEQWLLDDEPAVGVVNYRNNGKKLLERRRVVCSINESSVVVPVMWFDALFNAFHHQSIKHILPLPTQFDKVCWCTSQLHVIYSSELIFRGQALEYVAITAYNRQHRPYPRAPYSRARGPAIIEGIQNKAPKVYQNRTLFKTLKTNQLKQYSMNTTTYCMNKTRRHPIVPYSHFEGQS